MNTLSEDNIKRIREYFASELSSERCIYPEPEYAYDQDINVLVDHMLNRLVNMGKRLVALEEQEKKWKVDKTAAYLDMKKELLERYETSIKEKHAIKLLSGKTLWDLSDLLND